MQYITTTELRTKSKSLVGQLKRGESVNLMHRSRIIGCIQPSNIVRIKKTTSNEFMKLMNNLAKNISIHKDSDLEKNYQDHMEAKYGKYIS